MEFGENPPDAIQAEQKKKIQDAERAGLSAKGKNELIHMISDHEPPFKIKLGSGGPEKLKPIRINILEVKNPVKVKVRWYPAKQHTCFNNYVSQLIRFGILSHNRTVTWHSALYLVSKTDKGQYQINVDLRPVKSATNTEEWPVPNLET